MRPYIDLLGQDKRLQQDFRMDKTHRNAVSFFLSLDEWDRLLSLTAKSQKVSSNYLRKTAPSKIKSVPLF